MKKYQISFIGSLKNSIGLTYRIMENVVAENEPAARIKLYQKYQHVFREEYTEVTQFVKGADFIS